MRKYHVMLLIGLLLAAMGIVGAFFRSDIVRTVAVILSFILVSAFIFSLVIRRWICGYKETGDELFTKSLSAAVDMMIIVLVAIVVILSVAMLVNV